MRRRLPILISGISLLLCLGSAVLWWRSWNHANLDEDRYSWLTSRADRCTIRSDAGSLTLFKPPPGNPNAVARLPAGITPPQPADNDLRFIFPPPYLDQTFRYDRLIGEKKLPTARETAAAIRNDQLLWMPNIGASLVSTANPQPYRPSAWCWTKVGSAAFLFVAHDVKEEILDKSWFGGMWQVPAAFSNADAIAVLLPALEDPQRFAAAHFLLLYLPPRTVTRQDIYFMPNQEAAIEGLRVELPEPPANESVFLAKLGLDARYEASQIPTIRDQWHRRLDVAELSAPWWSIVAVTAALPLLQIVRATRHRLMRQRRAKSGCCVACGYDMRDSGNRCPECGTEMNGGPAVPEA